VRRHRRSVNPEALVRFLAAVGAVDAERLAAGRSKPFSKNRDGFVMAEGAGAMVLESYDSAMARGATILGVVAGCGELTDSSTAPAPARTASRSSAACARRWPTPASSRSRSTTSTRTHRDAENDKMEYNTTAVVFGEHLSKIPVSSNKSMVGHTISAAGAVEAVFSLLTLEHQRISADHQLRGAGPGDPV